MSSSPVLPPTSPPDSTPPILELRNLLRLADHADTLPWRPFREGVDIYRLYGDGVTGPSAALLRFREAARIPFHHHQGYEHILVLAGRQKDEYGVVEAGDLRIHAPGTSHHVAGEAGCLVLAIYEKPVRFEAANAATVVAEAGPCSAREAATD